MPALRISCVAVLLATAAACDDEASGQRLRCSDPEGEATGIAWDRLSGRVAYTRWEADFGAGGSRESRGCIYLLDAAAQKVELLRDVRVVPSADVGAVGWADHPSFRPDGSTLTFAAQDLNGKWQLHDISLETRQETTLFVDPNGHHDYPAWSPDGERLAYFSSDLLYLGIYIDSEPIQDSSSRTRVAWLSADKFVASIDDDSSAGSLYVADLASMTKTRIVDVYSASPAVSPDGQKVAYERPDSDGESIWLAGIDGSGQTRLTIGYSDFEPAWSADGTSLLFIRSGQGLVQYDFALGTVVPVMPLEDGLGVSMAWMP